MIRAFLFILAASSLFACQGGQPDPESEKILPGPGLPSATLSFQGTLPCADCSGTSTVLTLVPDSLTYHLTEQYLGRPGSEPAFSRTGPYQIEYGLGDDSLAVIYRLDPESATPVFYLQLGDTAVELLDRERRRIDSKSDYRLRMTR
jgi:hypothetical protein